jgi:hypothetical protein
MIELTGDVKPACYNAFKLNCLFITSSVEWPSMDDDLKRYPMRISTIAFLALVFVFGVASATHLSAQTTSEKPSPTTTESEEVANPLSQLDWLVGDWVSGGEGYKARNSARWSENRKFIVSQFNVERPGGKPLCGTQRIGWDPAAERIRSWVFDSDGGISEGIWQQEGDAWVVKNTGVLPDGRRSSAANFWVRSNNDNYAIKSSHVKVDDEAVADFEVEFRRVRGGR